MATISALRFALLVVLLAGCGGEPASPPEPTVAEAPRPTPPVTTSPPVRPTPSTPAPASPTGAPTPTERPAPSADPRWRFFTEDTKRHTSPWFAGAHRVMIEYGCTAAPYYDPDPRCPGGQGFHHGIDVAMPCGTPLLSAVTGEVLDPGAPGTPGAAYGERPFRIRSGGRDVLIAHARRVLVQPGDQVRPGQRIALASDSAAPDGCHLHFEVRQAGGGVSAAVDPAPLLRLSR